MPSRKRARVSQPASSSPPSQQKSPTLEETPNKDEELLNDPWTDEEEIGLFKGLIRWKPTGIHKHFRLLALHQFLLTNGYIHPKNEHTKPKGIWRKLETLYDLEALDNRENARQLSDLSLDDDDDDEEEEVDDGIYSEAENKIHNEEFSLPDDEFGELKWQQRFAPEEERRDDSPFQLPDINLAEIAPIRFTPAISVEPSEVNTPSTTKSGRGRGGASKRGRGAAATRRSTRQAESVADEEEDNDEEEEVEEEDEKKDDDDDEEGGSEKEDDGDSEPEDTPARATRTGRGAQKDKAAPAKGKKRARREK